MQISSDLGYILAVTCFSLLVFGGASILLLGSILAILTPKKLLEKYFKEPHFSQLELEFMSGIPGGYFRTMVFAWTVIRPTKSHVKRNIADCHKVMPKWYFYSLKALLVIGLIPCIIGLGLMGFLLLVGPPIDA